MRFFVLLAAAALPAAALAQAAATPVLPKVGLKLGLSVGEEFGLYGGLDFKPSALPIRFDADAWSSFRKFGDRSAGVAFTVNYVKGFKGFYAGAGVGYAHATERGDEFDTVAAKLVVGSRLPFMGANLESSAIWAQRAIGAGHTIATVSVVWKL